MFDQKFKVNWEKDARDSMTTVVGFRETFMRNLFVDTIGYAGIVMIRRVHGLAHNVDVDGIADLERRREVQTLILELGEDLVMNRHSFSDIEDVTAFAGRRIA